MTHPPKKSLRILIKAVLLFVIFNYAFSFVPASTLWRVSLYNTLLPGKTRFPIESDLDLIFDVHEIASSPKGSHECKVVVLGDSSVWGYSVKPDETFSSLINAAQISTHTGRSVHVYNLGYPGLLTLQDVLLLQRALPYKPDLILWNVTLLSMLETKTQMKGSAIVQGNINIAQALVKKYGLAKGGGTKPALQKNKSFLDRKEEMARFITYQLNGIRWQATGGEPVGQGYIPIGMDVSASRVFQSDNLRPPTLNPNLFQFDVLNAGIRMAGDTPVVIINEPIQVVNGENSNIRYNSVYPRWIYDQYREIMTLKSKQYHWNYVDLWNIIPPIEFSDTPAHRTAKGEQIFSRTVKEIILKNACP